MSLLCLLPRVRGRRFWGAAPPKPQLFFSRSAVRWLPFCWRRGKAAFAAYAPGEPVRYSTVCLTACLDGCPMAVPAPEKQLLRNLRRRTAIVHHPPRHWYSLKRCFSYVGSRAHTASLPKKQLENLNRTECVLIGLEIIGLVCRKPSKTFTK